MLAVPAWAQFGDLCAVGRDYVAGDGETGNAAPAAEAVSDIVGGPGAKPIGEDGVIRVIVYPSDTMPAGVLGDYNHEQRVIQLTENWEPPVVHHLVVHQFTAEHMGWPSTDAREMRALFEGLAMVVESHLGYRVGPPREPTLADSLALPGWTGICDAGKQLVKAFDKIASATSPQIAKDAFIRAIKTYKDLNEDGEATFIEYSVALMRAGPGFEFTRQVVIAFDDLGALRDLPVPQGAQGEATPPN